MGLVDTLERFMKEKGIKSKMQLAKEAGIPYMTVVNFWEKGTENVKLSTLRKLAEYIGCTLDELVGDEPPVAGEVVKPQGLVPVPIVGTISCGNGSVAYEEIEGYEFLPRDWVKSGEYFILRARGDSMINARIHDGDLLIIRKQSTFQDGDIVAVIIDDEDAVLKRAYKQGDLLILQSENPNYEPIIRRPEDGDVIIVGVLEKVIINIKR